MKITGFTLIEIMVVLTLVFTLHMLGSQSYSRQVNKAKLLQAQADLLLLADKLEQYKLFNLSYIGAAGNKTSPDNTGQPWIMNPYSPSNGPQAEGLFSLSIAEITNNGFGFQITATPISSSDKTQLGRLYYFSDGRKAYDKNRDGELTPNEFCWDC